MNAVSRSVDIPPPRRGRRELNEDTGVRLGLHIKSAEQAMMAAKTEALRSFGLTVGASPPSCGTTSSPSSGQDTADHCCLGPKITTASANRDGSAPCCVSGI